MGLAIGDAAPDFTLPDQDGRSRSLVDLLQPGPLLLYFYPADFTPGCTREACAIRDLHTALVGLGRCVEIGGAEEQVELRAARGTPS